MTHRTERQYDILLYVYHMSILVGETIGKDEFDILFYIEYIDCKQHFPNDRHQMFSEIKQMLSIVLVRKMK